MDEPTATLGVAQNEKVNELITDLKDQRKTVLLISHSLDSVFSVADRLIVLRPWRRRRQGPAGCGGGGCPQAAEAAWRNRHGLLASPPAFGIDRVLDLTGMLLAAQRQDGCRRCFARRDGVRLGSVAGDRGRLGRFPSPVGAAPLGQLGRPLLNRCARGDDVQQHRQQLGVLAILW
jgi:hypothetical protein